ncbi:hypothetical protein ACHAWU_004752 [Discostella pseudostelligera]|uniref:N-alpha-acetyltransferase 40 n=1 Tax=Discostella pseudostelligera TaxID=259834 RepID=A0ABD3MDW8_9STRA
MAKSSSNRRTRQGVVADIASTGMATVDDDGNNDEVDNDDGPRRRRSRRRRRNNPLDSILEHANAELDPPELSTPSHLPSSSYSSSTQNEIDIKIRHYTSQLIPTDTFRHCLELFVKNMSDMYADSHWGLDMHEKEAEMRHESARFLVALSSSSSLLSSTESTTAVENDAASAAAVDVKTAMSTLPMQPTPPPTTTATIAPTIPSNDTSDSCTNEPLVVLGFIHYRYECDDETKPSHPITYLYEIQIHQSHQKLGLGSRLLSLVETISRRLHMKKVMLTVFRANANAMAFYDRRGYSIDKCSPSNHTTGGEGGNDCDYEILSKIL